MMQLAVTPHALLLDGMPVESSDLAVVEMRGAVDGHAAVVARSQRNRCCANWLCGVDAHIFKAHTPLEILNKPDKLAAEEFNIVKQHVVDGAHVLPQTPETPALARVVAFEHHPKQDLSGCRLTYL